MVADLREREDPTRHPLYYHIVVQEVEIPLQGVDEYIEDNYLVNLT